MSVKSPTVNASGKHTSLSLNIVQSCSRPAARTWSAVTRLQIIIIITRKNCERADLRQGFRYFQNLMKTLLSKDTSVNNCKESGNFFSRNIIQTVEKCFVLKSWKILLNIPRFGSRGGYKLPTFYTIFRVQRRMKIRSIFLREVANRQINKQTNKQTLAKMYLPWRR